MQSHVVRPGSRVERWEDVTVEDWSDWKWHLQNRLTTAKEVLDVLPVPEAIRTAAEKAEEFHIPFETGLTPYLVKHIAGLLLSDPGGACALLKTVLPSTAELSPVFIESRDGMGEDQTGTHTLLSQLYKNRALLFVSSVCPVYCRFCFRRRKVGSNSDVFLSTAEIQQAIDRIADDPSIDDVIVSGGDPLMMPDNRLIDLLHRLRAVPTIRIVRFDTKMATVLPQRITAALAEQLSRYHPLYLTLHFVHPAEITNEVRRACSLLADAGIPLGAYTPLLRGINDQRETLVRLFTELAYMRVRPYYIVHNVANRWTDHFTVPLERAFDLMDGLQGEISGPALPSLVVYLPNAGGKVPLSAQGYRPILRTDRGWKIKGHDGREHEYPDIMAGD